MSDTYTYLSRMNTKKTWYDDGAGLCAQNILTPKGPGVF